MIAYYSQKVNEGKIVKVEIDFDDVIKKIKITGDFFMHPEEVLDDMEESIVGLEKNVSVDLLLWKIRNVAGEYDTQMIGISPESLAFVIKGALK